MQDGIDNISISTDREANADGRQNISPQNDSVEGECGVRESAESADGEACEGKEGEINEKDTPNDEIMPVYEQVGWKEKVQKFLQDYPIAKEFALQIGKEIAADEELALDAGCLEKALAITLAKAYVPPQRLATDEEFLQKYILSNQDVKDRILESYFDDLQKNLPPKSISSRGQTTITPPDKPKSIDEAGRVIKAMLNNRRI